MAVAVVFGASGISGWGITKALLDAKTQNAFSKIIALTNRSLSLAESGLPDDDRLQLHSGIDLQANVDDVIAKLRERIPSIGNVTHVFYTAFSTSHTDNQLMMKASNTKMLRTMVEAMETVAPSLSFIAVQTGSNHYGILFAEVLGERFGPVPLKEDLPRLPSPLRDSLMFYAMADEMDELSRGKSWKWCDIRPDMIVGYLPRPNSHSIAESIGYYLAFHAYLTPGEEVPFPGSEAAWNAKFSLTGQGVLGNFNVHLACKNSIENGEAFNIANKPFTTWASLWPLLAGYWGLKGTAPVGHHGIPDAASWVLDNMDRVKGWEEKYSMKPGRLFKIPWRYFHWALNMPFDRYLDLTRCEQTGFQQHEEHKESFETAWKCMQEAKLLPIVDKSSTPP
ncbi:hypothetical protein IAQ61_007442 [Plenodomus lingam]|uniref:Short chain dehydrogenase sirQ n=2 Tax=Leptosphaeria maculans TaxID=5022 RepID=SIRQ_LEPMC|nr:similar to NAD-dependent epimerase/dehydratase [Plenodomus lingam JN3]Q6Q888.1 RecName: Full=Short chain dehydrogenase sirQ; AltName: Full=Sirodesmin biosynthesis protein Q [Plenodomus lingam]AAS92540.1 SirQ [Plenodomus lingam]KAH9866853.1 hypothetical protein IAQ61_007442 [Plenodomus lingam]CBX98948.1 similar to NAD-dependent epimerase/dehydratase [Plenodomus lingam JN3]